MKIALVNCSPKIKNSASHCILQELKPFLSKDDTKIYDYSLNKPKINIDEMQSLSECNVLIFAFPLYVDAIPSHLLNCLIELEKFFRGLKKNDITVYALVNCGFYEGRQNHIAIEIMKNWCVKSGLKWGQGVGIGAGGMIPSIKNVKIGHGPKKNLEKAFKLLSTNILKCTSEEDIFITANFPRILYKLAAEMAWRKAIRSNGLKRKDLFLRK
ncbi:hypothetical protein ACER0A_007105 [Haloimpatiens sp. FM7315]|uniref:hypothetical protein n=1 Tax=Haloimpatiens sp. FM7315 TaxID=3298609 RepID=UPI0035A2D09A